MSPKRDKPSVAERRRIGVDRLISRGWSRRQIADEAGVNIHNLRELMKDGKGERSAQGRRLDLYLDLNHAFDAKITSGPPKRRPVATHEEAETYSMERVIKVPSAEQIEDAAYRARELGDEKATASVRQISELIFEIRKLSRDVDKKFADTMHRIDPPRPLASNED